MPPRCGRGGRTWGWRAGRGRWWPAVSHSSVLCRHSSSGAPLNNMTPHNTTPHRTTPHHTKPCHTTPHHTTQDGGTSSLVSPPGLATILLPDFSNSAIALLLAFLTTGAVIIPVDRMEELGQLAAVLELKIDYTAALAGSRSGDLVRVWRSGAGASWWSSNPGTQDLLREKRKRKAAADEVCENTFTSEKIFNTCWSTSHLSTSVTSVESRLRGLTICSDTWGPGACPPAKCNWCGRSFTRRSSLITHNLVAYLYTGWFF